MDVTIFTQAAQLGGTVFTVVAFLWYLTGRDNHWASSLTSNAEANIKLARALQQLTDRIDRNSTVNLSNTAKIDENLRAVSDNTAVIDKNTEILRKTNGH